MSNVLTDDNLSLSHLNDYPIAQDDRSHQLLSLALKVAQSDITVMIEGESGSGKEVMTRFIHRHSKRAMHSFLAINCAAIPEHMLEATLFGYEKGAFTGAYKSSSGKFEQAEGGSLLLDEISEMSLALQAKLLRVLQEKEVERIGSHKIIKLNVRILATTNRDLTKEIAAGRFREDLYYRLNGFPLRCLALRERKQDIIPMATYFINKYSENQTALPVLSKEASEILLKYSWPGNVRELENIIQRALILQTHQRIEAEHLTITTNKAYS